MLIRFVLPLKAPRPIACGLGNLQKIADGEPLGGRSTAEADFADLDDEDDDDFLN